MVVKEGHGRSTYIRESAWTRWNSKARESTVSLDIPVRQRATWPAMYSLSDSSHFSVIKIRTTQTQFSHANKVCDFRVRKKSEYYNDLISFFFPLTARL